MAEFGDTRLPRRFWEKVQIDPESGCWRWTACTSRDGYALVHWNGKGASAHRVAYEVLTGEIPLGLHLDHLCRVRSCVNPGHLEPVTCGENARRGNTGINNASKTHCPQGHPYDEENTYFRPESGARRRRGRNCRACLRASDRRRTPRHNAEDQS